MFERVKTLVTSSTLPNVGQPQNFTTIFRARSAPKMPTANQKARGSKYLFTGVTIVFDDKKSPQEGI